LAPTHCRVFDFHQVLGFADEFETINEDEDGLPLSKPKEDEPLKLKMHVDALDIEAYNKLPMRMAPKSSMPPGVRPLVRYVNALPTIRSRVILKPMGADITTTFINANYVPSFDAANPKAYIISQGPKPDLRNTADFWRMVWETKVKAIVMVTGVTEGGVEKCARWVLPCCRQYMFL
jgi:protein tyrosine phosphatase